MNKSNNSHLIHEKKTDRIEPLGKGIDAAEITYIKGKPIIGFNPNTPTVSKNPKKSGIITFFNKLIGRKC